MPSSTECTSLGWWIYSLKAAIIIAISRRVSDRFFASVFRYIVGGALRSTSPVGLQSNMAHYRRPPIATVGQLLFAPWAWVYSTLHPFMVGK